MEFTITAGQFFLVPLSVTEHFLKLATHDQLKVLLYVLSRQGEPLSDETVAQMCSVRVETVEEAIAFWRQVNVLSVSTIDTVPIVLQKGTAATDSALEAIAVPVAQPALQAAQTVEPASPPEARVVPANVQVTSNNYPLLPSEIAARKAQSPDMSAMLTAVEQQAGRLLTHTELRSIFWMWEYLGLAPDLILMLVVYCISIGAFQVRYLEKVAVEWQERGILTHEQAQQDIQRRAESRSYIGQLMKLFEMKRQPTPRQQAFMSEWQANGESLEMVELAYHKTREHRDDRLDFSYLNGILKHWRESGVKTPQQVTAADEAYFAQLAGAAATKKRKSQASASTATNEAAAEEHSYALDDFKALMNQF